MTDACFNLETPPGVPAKKKQKKGKVFLPKDSAKNTQSILYTCSSVLKDLNLYGKAMSTKVHVRRYLFVLSTLKPETSESNLWKDGVDQIQDQPPVIQFSSTSADGGGAACLLTRY